MMPPIFLRQPEGILLAVVTALHLRSPTFAMSADYLVRKVVQVQQPSSNAALHTTSCRHVVWKGLDPAISATQMVPQNPESAGWLDKQSDMLPAHLKSSILTCGYNADLLSFLGRASDERILEHAHTLVAEMVADRQVRSTICGWPSTRRRRPFLPLCSV
jgi:hypothetical protein